LMVWKGTRGGPAVAVVDHGTASGRDARSDRQRSPVRRAGNEEELWI